MEAAPSERGRVSIEASADPSPALIAGVQSATGEEPIDADAFYRELRQFQPATIVYRHSSRFLTYTEGVKFAAERLGAEWLIALIARLQPCALRVEEFRVFQLWELFVNRDRSAVLLCSRDANDIVIKEWIRRTNCPIDYLRLEVQGGVLMLPSER